MSTVVNPVCNHRSNGDHASLNADQQTAVAGLGTFGLIGWNRGRIHSVADASDDSAEDELEERNLMWHRSHLDNHPYNHHDGTNDDHPPSA